MDIPSNWHEELEEGRQILNLIRNPVFEPETPITDTTSRNMVAIFSRQNSEGNEEEETVVFQRDSTTTSSV